MLPQIPSEHIKTFFQSNVKFGEIFLLIIKINTRKKKIPKPTKEGEKKKDQGQFSSTFEKVIPRDSISSAFSST